MRQSTGYGQATTMTNSLTLKPCLRLSMFMSRFISACAGNLDNMDIPFRGCLSLLSRFSIQPTVENSAPKWHALRRVARLRHSLKTGPSIQANN